MIPVYDLKGQAKGKVELPAQFSEAYRPDLIKRVVVALESHDKQPKGTKIGAGDRFAAYRSKRRHEYKTTYGYNSSRTPGKTVHKKGTRLSLIGANVPQAVGGRQAHPPRTEKVLKEKINNTERKKAIRSALYASTVKELVEARGHKIQSVKELPLIVVNDIESLDKTKKIYDFISAIGLSEELERTKEKKIRAGKGKMRGRKYRFKKGPLFVVSKRCKLMETAQNIPGADAVLVKDLNAMMLAPGTQAGRLTIWSEEAVKMLKEKKMFM